MIQRQGSETENQKLRNFESTKLKLQMLPSKTQEIKLDDYINNLSLDNECLKSHSSNSKGINPSKNSARKCDLASEPPIVFANDGQFNSPDFAVTPSSEINDIPNVDYIKPQSVLPSDATKCNRPEWLNDFSNLLQIYQNVLETCTKSYGLDSGVIYDIFKSSNLNPETLYHIWSLTSRTRPGLFTPMELVIALALIGIAQRDHWAFGTSSSTNMLTIRAVYDQCYPPIPIVKADTNKTGSMDSSKLTPGFYGANMFHPPVVACSTFFNYSKDIQSFKPVIDAKNDPPTKSKDSTTTKACAHIVSQEWSEFTAFVKSTSSSTDVLENVTAAEISLIEPYLNFADDFGEFQTVCTNASATLPAFDSSSSQVQLNSISLNISSIDTKDEPNYCSDLIIRRTRATESLRKEWICCLKRCLSSFRDALDVLSLLKTESEKVEFGSTDEGRDFILDLLEIYVLAKRINISARKYGVLNPELQQEFSDIDSVFGKLLLYLILPDMKQQLNSLMSMLHCSTNNSTASYSEVTIDSMCGVCLYPLDVSNKQSMESSGYKSVHISLAGRNYHAPCANFWTNQIQLSLPALSPPNTYIPSLSP